MTNEQIAKTVSNIVFSPKKNEFDPNFAVQLMVEKFCCYPSDDSYSKEVIEERLLHYLNKIDKGVP